MKHGEEFNPYKQFYGLFIPNSIAMQPELLDSHKLLLGRLMQFAGQNGKAYPTVKRLSKELAWDKRKVQRNIKNLKDLGLLNVNRLDPNNSVSPNVYTFPYSPLYDDIDDATNVTGSDQEINGASTPGDTDVTTPVSRMSPHIIESEIIESPLLNNSSKEESHPADSSSGPDAPLVYNGLLCSICKEPQFVVRSGDTCSNGHGGVEGIEKEEIAPASIFPTKMKKIVKTPNPFGYTPEALKIVTYWQTCGGKTHFLKTSGNGIDKIKNIIEELLMPGLNTCYLQHARSQEIKMKQWTIEEIKSSINFYANIQNKPIDKMYFSQFVEMVYHGNVSRNFRNHSPLLDSFRNLPDEATEKWQALLRKKFNKLFPSIEINSTVLLNTARYLVEQDKEFVVVDSGVLGNHMVNLYVSYMRRIVTAKGDYESLKYMSGQKNLDDFVTYFLTKSVKLKKRSKVA